MCDLAILRAGSPRGVRCSLTLSFNRWKGILSLHCLAWAEPATNPIYYYNYLQQYCLRSGDVVIRTDANVKVSCKIKKKNPFETVT